MDKQTIITTLFLGILPISELRGAIPFAYFSGLSLPFSLLLGLCANLFVSPIAYIFLSYFHRFFYKYWPFYAKTFNKTVLRVRHKLGDKVNKYGMWGVLLFVGIPLPVTGAWTGTLGAWVLGLDRKHSIIAVSGGVFLAGAIITILLLLGTGFGSIFLKLV